MKDTSNEITIKILCNKNELINLLESKGCKYDTQFRLDDTYYLKEETKQDSNVRDLLQTAIIERIEIEDNKTTKQLIHKNKNFDINGKILAQEKYSLNIIDEKEVDEFLKSIGYYKTIRLIEDDIIYKFEDIGLVVKDVLDMGLLMEIETRENSKYNTIDKLKELVDYLHIPYMRNEYFIKKAEIALNKNINLIK